MNVTDLVNKIYPGVEFNPACFEFTEEEARARLLWRDPRPMPTQVELEAVKADVAAEQAKEKLKTLFTGIRRLWQSLSDDFAAENALLGITQEGRTKEIADKFSQVVYYLNVNAPKEAIAAIDLVVRDEKYCTDARLNALKLKLVEFINANS